MEIRIRTYDEVSSERVTIEVTPGQRAEIQVTGDQEVTFNTADQDVSGEASWYQVALDRKAQIRALRAELARKTAEWEKSSAEGRAQVERLVKRVEEAEGRRNQTIQEFNTQKLQHTKERQAAARSIAARDDLLSKATTRMEVVRSLLAAPQVTETRDGIVTSKGTVLANAIGNALAALDA